MRAQFLIALLLVVASAGTFWYKTTAYICPAPLGYRVGDIEAAFGISEEAARAALRRAEAVWETEAGRELFYEDQSGPLLVEFIFDERQAQTNEVSGQRRELDAKQREIDELQSRLDVLNRDYTKDAQAHRTKVEAYEARLQAYNDMVTRYNDRGGATAAEFEALRAEQEALDREVTALNRTTDTLRALSDTINELGEKVNALVEVYNKEVKIFNDEFGLSDEFTQGDYQDGVISIYEFSNEAELVAVLAHEFGHALGISHVDGSSSIMYYLLESQTDSLVLSEHDKEAFNAICGTGNERLAQARRLIREFIQ